MIAPRERALARFAAVFGEANATVGWRAPGRVNLIGEHVDYSGGLVLPIAIDRDTFAVARARVDFTIRVVSNERPGVATIDLKAPRPATGAWHDYISGIAFALSARGVPLTGADIAVASDVPLGAGLSSSAALEVATAGVLLSLMGASTEARLLAGLGREAENAYVGVQSGIMDQLVCVLAVRDKALLIDCRTEAATPVALPAGIAFVIAESGIRHSLADGAYNRRRAESDAVQGYLGDVRAATPAVVEAISDPLLRRRARHIVSENIRVQAFIAALQAGDDAAAGRSLDASHASLRDDYEVSIPPIDALVEAARQIPGVLGARMTGGGFGGSIISLVARSEVAEVVRRLLMQAPNVMVVQASDGASRSF